MRCVVTAGPTYEPLDQVRRLTNLSTGRLGSELVNHLSSRGHEVTLLIGQQATYRGERRAARVTTVTTAEHLAQHLQEVAASGSFDAVFHAAAVGDFRVGQVFSRQPNGELRALASGKFSTREGPLLAELVPTAKIISQLRTWFPNALLVGWKYEVEGDRQAVLELGRRQVAENRTNACVLNGPAYGPGFGLLRKVGGCVHLGEAGKLYEALERLMVGA